MPFRRRFRRSVRRTSRRLRRRRPFYGSKDRKGEVMINKTPAKLHNVIAPHYFTRLEAGFSGNRPAAAGAAAYFDVDMTPYLPFDPSVGKLFTDASPGPAGVLVPATLALNALEPVGTAALSALYKSYRCYAARLDVTYTPTAGADGSMLIVVPFSSGSGGEVTDAQIAMSLPYSKAITCTGNNNVKQNRISMYMDLPTLLGLTRTQYNDLSTSIGNFQSSNPGVYGQFRVFMNTLSGNALTAIAIVEVRVCLWIEAIYPVPNLGDT